MLFISSKFLKQFKYIMLIIITLILVISIYNHKNDILKYFYPTKYSEYVEKYSKQYNVDPYLIFAIMRVESGFKPLANSKSGAKGLMQIMDGTAKDAAKSLKIKDYDSSLLFEPEFNIMIGCWYVNNLIKHFDGNIIVALTAYNGGSGNVDKWLKNKEYSKNGKDLDNIPFSETKNYLDKIKKDYKVYKSLYK